MSITSGLLTYWNALKHVLFPSYCAVCKRRLQVGEGGLCLSCLQQMPFTHYRGEKGNPTELQLGTLGPRFRRASSLMFYVRKNPYCQVIFDFKYHGLPQVAVQMGRIMAQDLVHTDFFDGITCIVPVPIAAKRVSQRGYNQSEMLARGISQVTGIPVVADAVKRKHFKQTQTHLNAEQRAENVKDAFLLANPAALEGQHALLVDDVITYGHTMRACAQEVLKADGAMVSVLTLATSYVRLSWKLPPHIHPWD